MLAFLRAAGRGHRKKLEEAARLWARREFKNEAEHVNHDAEATDKLDEQFAFFGIRTEGPVDAPERLLPFYLFPENLPAWQLFMAVQTQWRGGMAREGLDYPGVHAVIDQRRSWRLRRRQRFAEIQVMERASLDAWAEQAADDKAGRRS